MADSGSRSAVSLSVIPPNQIPKDVLGSENPIPLSPQWLLPKPGESKAGVAPEVNHGSPYSGYTNRPELLKSPRHEEENEIQKKKDVFQQTFPDSESGRRDRWRDEERESNPLLRRGDRWREGDKELGYNKRIDRWVDNSIAGRLSEARRPSSERWTDPTKDTNYDQRRESKWNTRWGPDDKEVDTRFHSSKQGDGSQDKGLSHAAPHGREDKESDHYRPWRSTSSQTRGRVEPQHRQSQMESKEGPLFPHGRGRGDSAPPTFSAGRGRVGFGGSSMNNFSAPSQPIGFVSEKGEGLGDASPLKYSRTKLLDVYRVTDTRSSNKLLQGLVQVPPITQEEPLEPLALYAPSAEEMGVLKGIDKGEIVSSGAPQISKDGSNSRSSIDFPYSSQKRHGSKDVLPFVLDVSNDSNDSSRAPQSNFSVGSPCEKQFHSYISGAKVDTFESRPKYTDAFRGDGSFKMADEVPTNRESDKKGFASVQSGIPWRSSSVGNHAHTTTHDGFNIPADVRGRNSDTSRLQAKHYNNDWESGIGDPSDPQNESKWQVGQDHTSRRQSSLVLDKEQEPRKLLQPSPEDLLLFYKDPQGEVQGPFSGVDIIGWYESGYFALDLQVRLANAPNETPFSSLGDVMPHLRAKARPPPGFAVPKQNEIPDVSGRVNLTNFGKGITGLSDTDRVRNELRHSSSTDAENRFLESLMSASLSSSPLERFASSEGLQAYIGHNPGSMPGSGVEGTDALNLLAKRMTVDRQRSLPNPYSYWPARDAVSVGLTHDILHDSSIPEAKPLLSIPDLSRQSVHPQNADMMAILRGLSDRSPASINNGVVGWPTFPTQVGLDPFKDKIDLHQAQGFPHASLGLQQQRLQPQQHPLAIANLLQAVGNSSSMLTTEKLISSGLSQDPQVLNLLLQQQNLLQLQSQASLPSQPPSILEKLLLLQQQQKQDEQQQLLLQQQQLLTHVLAESQSAQRFGEPSYGHLQSAGVSVGNAVMEQPRPSLSHQMFQVGSHVPVSGIREDSIVDVVNLLPRVLQDHKVDAEPSSSPLPHHILGSPRKSGASVPAAGDETKMTVMAENRLTPEKRAHSSNNPSLTEANTASESYLPPTEHLAQDNSTTEDPASSAALEVPADSIPSGTSLAKPSMETTGIAIVLPGQANEAKVLPVAVEPLQIEEQKTHELIEPPKAQTHDVKKNSEKKSRKSKSSKVQATTDQTKGLPTGTSVHLSHEFEAGATNAVDMKEVIPNVARVICERTLEKPNETVDAPEVDNSASRSLSRRSEETVELKSIVGSVESIASQTAPMNSLQRAWKQAVNVRAKSLVEIQQEEQKKVQTEFPASTESVTLSSIGLSNPWAGVQNISEPNVPEDALLHAIDNGVQLENPKSRKGQPHNLLAQEVLAKSSERDIKVSETVSAPPSLSTASTQSHAVDDDNFIETKGTKKNRKKAAKAKSAGNKVSALSSPTNVTVAPSPADKGKTSKQQSEKDFLPAPPLGPSLGDFIPWKGEAISPSSAPAWSTDSGKVPKPTSLRDILKEQEKKFASQSHFLIPTQKSQTGQTTRAESRSLSSSSPSKTASPIVISNASSQSKSKGEDDFFWGPLDQSKQETKQVGFPQLANIMNGGAKTTPVTASPGASSGFMRRQKSVGGGILDSLPLSSFGQSSLKSKRDANTKHSEAMDFRDWCENESVRLTGSTDTSFLEFCSRQSRSEAEILLIQNLGTFDPNHEFIHKFLDYMEMLSADVLDIAFQIRHDQKAPLAGSKEMIPDNASAVIIDRDIMTGADGSAKGGKKKGKKGKKVSPSVLGFNVMSNRIMMGEIQTVED
ncbi:hypothetical protein Dimus_025560 [Dionaea muscipula]